MPMQEDAGIALAKVKPIFSQSRASPFATSPVLHIHVACLSVPISRVTVIYLLHARAAA